MVGWGCRRVAFYTIHRSSQDGMIHLFERLPGTLVVASRALRRADLGVSIRFGLLMAACAFGYVSRGMAENGHIHPCGGDMAI